MKRVITGLSGNFEIEMSGLDWKTFLAEDKIGSGSDSSFGIGGTSLDLALGLTRFGNIKSRLILTVGPGGKKDPFRDILSSDLTDLGVDHHLLPCRSFTSFATILNFTNGVSKVVGRKSPFLYSPVDEITAQTQEFSPDVVVATGVMPNEVDMAIALFRAAPENALRALNPRPELIREPEKLNRLLLCADLLVINAAEATQILGHAGWRSDKLIWEINRCWSITEVIVTLGPEGALHSHSDGQVIHQPAVDCGRVVDTTGAGDSFFVGYLASRLEGCPPNIALQYAATAAGISVTRGHGASSPTRQEVEAMMTAS